MTVQDHTQKLPQPKQVWAHSTTSIQELSDALEDAKITAIESDIVMGYDVKGNVDLLQPIMSHPPEKESDLSFATFIQMTTTTKNTAEGRENEELSPRIQKLLKLDVKEIDALDPILDGLSKIISELNHQGGEDGTIFLNADIIRGPGMRNDSLPIPKDQFLNSCMKFLKKDKKRQTVVCEKERFSSQ